MKRLLSAPLLSLVLFVAWLMLNESASSGHMLLGAALALVLPWVTRRWRPDALHIRRWGPLGRLTATVLRDIVVSNIDVACRVLGPEAAIHPRFVWVPLSLRDAHGIVALACIITLTPGTVSADLSDDRRFLLVQALHCPDDESAAALVADIQARYEAPLKEIFE